MDFRIFEGDFVVKKIEFYQLLLLEMMNKIITKDIDVNKSNKNQLESNKLHAQRVNRKKFFGTSNGTSKAGLDSCFLGSSIQCIRMSRQTPTFTYVSEGAHDDVATCGSNKHMSLMDISTGHVILSYMESYLRDPSQVHHEWLRLLSYQPDHSSTSVASLPCNASKNWSSHHLPYDKNRVVLRKEDNVNNSDYINASYIVDANPTRPSYIFTQHPLLHTITDFWQMVWETHSNVIINLTSLADQSEPYWPSDSSPSSYHHFQVHLISQHISHPDFIVRNLLVYNLSKNYNNNNTKNNIVNDNKKDDNNDKRNNESYDTTDKASNGAAGEKEHEGEGGDGVYNNQTNIYKHDENNNGNNNSNNSSSNNNSSNNNSNNNSSSNSRIVTIFHYFNWPSLHVPSTSSLLSFMRTVFRHYGGGKTTLIHCSNGSERTGTYGLIDIVLRRLNSGVREVNLEATVEHLREQRVAVVATKEQYEFSLRTVAQHITNCLLTPCSCK